MTDKSAYRLVEVLIVTRRAYETEISDEQMEKLKKIANEDDSLNKALVAKILVNSESEEGEKILLNLTNDKDSLVRTEACDSLCIRETMETYEAKEAF